MLLSANQISELLKIIENNTNIFIAKNIGSNYLSLEEKNKLISIGIKPDHLYNKDSDLINQSFNFGLISDSLGKDVNKLKFEDLKNYFKSGKHIPLTKTEQYAVESIKKQFLGDIKAHHGRIFTDLNGIISDKEKNNREAYEQVIRDEVKRKIVDGKTVNEVARDIARKTGDWSRNFNRIIEYQSHYALNEGRVAAIGRRDDENIKCYFDVFQGACRHCIRLYLTKGVGSQPVIFSLNEIKANGTNIGRKVQDWKPTLSPTHPYCRCTVNILKTGKVWDSKLKRFEFTKEIVVPKDRKPIHFTVTIDGKMKDYYV